MFTEESRTAKTKFSFLHLNIRSIYQNLSQLTDLLLRLEHQFHAIGISETWLKDSSHLVDIENYNFIHKHRKDRAGGEVGLYLSNDIDYKIRSNLKFENSLKGKALLLELFIDHQMKI